MIVVSEEGRYGYSGQSGSNDTQRNAEGERSGFIVPLLMKVAENRADFTGREELIAELAMRVERDKI